MGFSFSQPWLLLAIPVLVLWFWLVGRRKKPGLRGRVSLVLRSAAAVCLCLALAGAGLVLPGRGTQLIVLADRSQSMRGGRAGLEDWVHQVEAALPDHYDLSVVAFGGDTQVEQSFADSGFAQFQKQLRDDETNFEQAVRFASAAFSPDAAKQVLLLTDGRETTGDAGQVAALLKAQGIRVDAHLFEQAESGDAQVNAVRVSDTIYQNEAFNVVVEVQSEAEKQATLLLYGGGTLLGSRQVHLQKGENTFVFQDTVPETGMVTYKAVLQEEGGLVQNNEKSAVAKVIGAPRVLVVEGAAGAGDAFRKMLEAVAIEAATTPVSGLPRTAAGLQKYDAVVLANLPAEDCSDDQIAALDHFVKTLGRGLVVLGGDASYAMGGYIGSDLEAMMPVESNVRSQLDSPSLALVMAIDHSGSMSEDAGGVTLLDLAKESAQRAVEQLVPTDSVGVIAFDDTAKWVAELQSAANAEEVNRLVGGLKPGGGTMMYSSIEAAYQALQGSDAAIKHLILLTDGQPADGGFETLVAEMREAQITVSGVAMGQGANARLMQQLSMVGGGRFYQVDATDNIPAIFAKETQLSTGSYLQNRTFFPEYAMASPLTENFASGMPQLTGFMATVAKPTAIVALQSDNGLPILAHWQYGAGQVVAWTSDLQGQWSEAFLAWPDAAAFFGGFVANVLRTESGQGFLALTEQDGTGRLSLTVDGLDQAGTTASVIAPDGQTIEVPMHLEKPGVFAGQFPLEQEGVYVVRVDQTQSGSLVNSVEGGLPRGYSAEYDQRVGGDAQAVAKLLAAGGGRTVETAAELFEAPLEPIKSRVDLSLPLVIIGLVLFMLDIAARRLQWEAAALRFAGACKGALSSLRRSRKTAEDQPAQATQAPQTGAPAPEPAVAQTPASSAPPEAAPAAAPPAKSGGRSGKKKPEPRSSVGSELLARRRENRR